MNSTAELEKTEPQSLHTFLYLVYFIYFFCGLTQCFESVFLPEFKEYFHLTYQRQMYVMFAKNIPFLLAISVGSKIQRLGYKKCLTIAMLLYSVGTLMLAPSLATSLYWMVLIAFSIIGTGFTIQMVAGNPLLSALGNPERASSRLNFGNALGAIAQIIAPAALTWIIPTTVLAARAKLPYMQGIFITLGVGLVLLTISSAAVKNGGRILALEPPTSTTAPTHSLSLWKYPKVLAGFVAIFLVLGTEAGLFGFFRNYLEDSSIAGLTSHGSERLFTVYFALFALGRFAAAGIQKYVRPHVHLVVQLVTAMVCLTVAMFAKGIVAIIAVVLIGFFVSIFFPTLYSMASENMGSLTGQVSGLLTLGFLGCAVMPILQGKIADSAGLQRSYGLGLISYSFALLYVLRYWILRKNQTNRSQ